jgi:hypothetical protein
LLNVQGWSDAMLERLAHRIAHDSSLRKPSMPVVFGVPSWALVSSGILMFVWYIFMDVAASLAYAGYSYKDQTISELSAIGAPTRGFWLAMAVPYQVMAFTFAFGVLIVGRGRRTVRTVGWLLLAMAIVGPLWWLAPMHQRDVLAADGGTWQDTMHLVLGAVSSLLFFGAIAVGAFAFGTRFLVYSLATIAAMLVFGTLMSMQTSAVAADEPTPWLGIWERIVVEGAMLWQAVFASMLLWRQRELRLARMTTLWAPP